MGRMTCGVGGIGLKGELQLLSKRYEYIRLAHIHERVLNKRFVVLIIGNSKSNHLGAQGTFNMILPLPILYGAGPHG